jgi:hypothetical protein
MGMKATVVSVLGILAAVVIGFSVLGQRAEAQAGGKFAPAPGTPPIGAICEVRVLVATILSSKTEVETLRGDLIAMTDDWIVLKEGSFENWIPRDKVITLRASR